MTNKTRFSKRFWKMIIFFSTILAMINIAIILSMKVNKSQDDYIQIGLFIGFNLGFLGVVFINYYLDNIIFLPENINKNLDLLNNSELLDDKYLNGKRDQQHQIILAVINALNYEPLEIPTGGKSKIREICLKRVRVFTDSAFEHAWKNGTNNGLFRLLESDKFSSK